MIKNIQRLQSFAVFDDYKKPHDFNDFSDRNVIYGWNYSGKTSLSRLFGFLEAKKIDDAFAGCKFSIADSAGESVTEESISACAEIVRVFNSDFVERNLSWDGKAFTPILLLGEDSVLAEKQIEHFERLLSRCRASAKNKRDAVQAIEKRINDGKTVVAKQIKTTLGIVEAFTTVHLDKVLLDLTLYPNASTFTSEEIYADLKQAAASDTDRLPPVAEVVFADKVAGLRAEVDLLLQMTPEFAAVIEYLRTNREVAEWVAVGVDLHQDKTICVFCGSDISVGRMMQLRAHFSKDVAEHKLKLQTVRAQLVATREQPVRVRENDVQVQFRSQLKLIDAQFVSAWDAYRNWIDSAVEALDRKLDDQFTSLPTSADATQQIEAVVSAVNAFNLIITENNRISNNFALEKLAAIARLKTHYASQFRIDYAVDQGCKDKASHEMQAVRYEAAKTAAIARIEALNAAINKAQKGRETINRRIISFFGSEAIQIAVVKVEAEDRFQLMRHGKLARHLSEGEKTAIAFAFFLTKLEEIIDLKRVIVFIDDPISSLDSNHVFQVYSILRTTFFKFGQTESGKQGALTTCKQLFISTHNFEFFNLLGDFEGTDANPVRKYLVKRLSATEATFVNLPHSISKYASEYHYLFGVLHAFHQSSSKGSFEHLLALPNAARRFVELYTCSRLPLKKEVTVDRRAARLFGPEKALRIMKMLHYFSHGNSVERLATNSNLIADIDGAIGEIMAYLQKEDDQHYAALIEAIG